MDAEGLWRLFLLTGLPEAYSLYCLLAQAAGAEEREKTA